MIKGRFGKNGELFFEIELIAINGESFFVQALLDTGFTTGWLAINTQDIEFLEWELIASQIAMQTARGIDYFDLYQGKIIIDEQEFNIPIHVGDEIPEVLIGMQWLEVMEIVINKSQNILTLELQI